MRGSEAESLGAAAADLAVEVTGWVQGVHEAVATRVFRNVGPIASPVKTLHDGITRGVYAAVRGATATTARTAGRIGAARLGEDGPPLDATARGDQVLGAVNGILGDRLERDAAGVAIRPSFRYEGRDVSADDLVAALGATATAKVAVFVHGLCETDAAWRWRAEKHTGSPDLGHPSTLADALGFTPVLLRYNTGRHISDNGASLDLLLDELVAAWPVALDDLVLIGHSMGGLVARSATVVGARREAVWVRHLRHVACIGAPHTGAPLERLANLGAWALKLVGESAPFGDLLNVRSAGIKDLRYGYTSEDEWRDHDPDEVGPDRRGVAETLDHVRYTAIAATVGQRDRGVGAEVLGDLLVGLSSATGRTKRGNPVAFHDAQHVRGIDHLDLLTHPDVSAHLVRALSTPTSGS